MKRKVTICILVATALILGGLTISKVVAQPAQPPAQPRQPGMFMPMMGMPMMGGGSLVASGNYIYVLWAGSIYVYQFDTKEKKLTQVTSVELPRPQMPQFAPPAGFPGGPQFGPPAGGAFFPPQPPQQGEPLQGF